MKKFLAIVIVLTLIGCSTISDLQCDELYMVDYRCDLPQHNIYLPSSTYTPRTYYPVPYYYYAPLPLYASEPCPTPPPPSTPQREVVRVSKRPSIYTRDISN